MIQWGISALSHDSALTVLNDNELVFASHGERFSRKKNDKFLNQQIIDYALQWGSPDEVYFHENELLRKTRIIRSGRFSKAFSDISIKNHLRSFGINKKVIHGEHHLSHLSSAYYTNQEFKKSIVIIIDAIGEWDTFSIYLADNSKFTKVHSMKYPHSIGLFYSAFTDLLGLKPNEEEYILMGMSAFGKPSYKNTIKNNFIKSINGVDIKFKHNVHRGCRWFIDDDEINENKFDIASSVQNIYEDILLNISEWCRKNYSDYDKLILMGGCALNCVANSKIADKWNNIWIFPNPGDAGSSLGAITQHTNKWVEFNDAFWGYDIVGEYPVEKIINELMMNKIVGVANGKAEFGPRALGHRSILADPRGHDVKDRVNEYKKREKFRPFSPMILEEFADDYFYMPIKKTPYMQFVALSKFPEKFPAIVHYDGTSRVQTVSNDKNSNIRKLLNEWYDRTGCPMLLNTSLNIKGQPLVNNEYDASLFEHINKLNVCIS